MWEHNLNRTMPSGWGLFIALKWCHFNMAHAKGGTASALDAVLCVCRVGKDRWLQVGVMGFLDLDLAAEVISEQVAHLCSLESKAGCLRGLAHPHSYLRGTCRQQDILLNWFASTTGSSFLAKVAECWACFSWSFGKLNEMYSTSVRMSFKLNKSKKKY